MPYTVQQLFSDRETIIPPTGIEQHISVQDALNIMLKKQYSQLPVVDKDNRLVGEYTAYMVTYESILDALSNLNVVPKVLRVSDAMVRVRPYRLEDQLSDLLEALRDTFAVPIIAEKRLFVGVVTSYDTTEYFRKRAEDMMHIEQIEKKLKEYITAYFTNQDGEIDYASRDAAILDSMPSNKELRGPFKKALQYFLELLGEKNEQINDKLAQQAFDRHLSSKGNPKPFDKLSFDDYIKLLVHQERWKRYKHIFPINNKDMEVLLCDIRDTRNDLAHFRIESITYEQRRKIQYCNDWLDSFHDAIIEEFQKGTSDDIVFETPNIMEPINEPIPIVDTSSGNEENPSFELLQLLEENPTDSRYAPLAIWLQEQLPSDRAVQLTFQQVEAIMGDVLPASAHERSWWANDSKSHIQSQQWLEVGWRVSKINMREETVVFTRIKDREKLYIDFFSELLSDLKTTVQFPVKQSSPDGVNWMTIAGIPRGTTQKAFLGFSFTRRARFRVELYIDSGDKARNKTLFDTLHKRKSIILSDLAGIPGSLEWERIDEKRASRIALYHKGAIADTEEELAFLRNWAVDAMIKLQKVMEKHVSEAV
jgi:Domain of unknown function (DUF4268)/CBS domain